MFFFAVVVFDGVFYLMTLTEVFFSFRIGRNCDFQTTFPICLLNVYSTVYLQNEGESYARVRGVDGCVLNTTSHPIFYLEIL